ERFCSSGAPPRVSAPRPISMPRTKSCSRSRSLCCHWRNSTPTPPVRTLRTTAASTTTAGISLETCSVSLRIVPSGNGALVRKLQPPMETFISEPSPEIPSDVNETGKDAEQALAEAGARNPPDEVAGTVGTLQIGHSLSFTRSATFSCARRFPAAATPLPSRSLRDLLHNQDRPQVSWL